MNRRDFLASSGAMGLGYMAAHGTGDQLVGVVSAQSGGPQDEISGTVMDSNGPVSGATVVAVPHDDGLGQLQTTTDSNGDYIFGQLDLHDGDNLYHVIARDGSSSNPRRGRQNYPFISADGSPPDSGVSRWPFEQNVLDQWGQNDGVDNTGVGYSTDAQVGSYSKIYDGTGAVELPNLSLSSNNPFSISLWVKNNDPSQSNAYFSRYDGTNILDFYSPATSEISFVLGELSGDFYDLDGPMLSADTWYHAVAVFDDTGPSARLYLDGQEEVTATGPISNFSEPDGPWIGGRTDGNNFMDGLIDDVRLYDKALTGQEVSNLYNSGSIA